MDDITQPMAANDRAFIKVAVELRQLENAVAVGETMTKLNKRMSSAEASHRQNYSSGDSPKTIALNCLGTDNCPEPFASYAAYIYGVQTGFSDMEARLAKYRERIIELKRLFDLYCEGKDIVMEKLARVRDDLDESGDQ